MAQGEPLMFDDEHFVPVEEAAQRMGITAERVVELVKQGVLRSSRDGLVLPAIISGAVE
jgi:hypothetical protein